MGSGHRTLYETGTKNGVLYVYDASATTTNGYATGVAWNGLTAVTESPSGAEETALYADDDKYLSLRSKEEFGATIEAYMYPDAFAACDGSAEPVPGLKFQQQSRKKFCFVFKTVVGNDTEMDDHGYKIHIIYNASAAPSERSYATINDSPEAITFSWEVTTTPIEVGTVNNVTYKKTANIIIDSTKVTNAEYLATLENYLFGSDTLEPQILTPAQVYSIISTGALPAQG